VSDLINFCVRGSYLPADQAKHQQVPVLPQSVEVNAPIDIGDPAPVPLPGDVDKAHAPANINNLGEEHQHQKG